MILGGRRLLMLCMIFCFGSNFSLTASAAQDGSPPAVTVQVDPDKPVFIQAPDLQNAQNAVDTIQVIAQEIVSPEVVGALNDVVVHIRALEENQTGSDWVNWFTGLITLIGIVATIITPKILRFFNILPKRST